MSNTSASLILNNKDIWFTDIYIKDFPENSPERKLMEIFAYGTLNDYETIRKDLPKEYQFESDSIALNKLKSLTILSIMQDKIEYSFNQLKEDLGIDNTISAEDLITDLMSAGLYTGKIDELNGTFTCERVASRCVPNNQENISEIINDLKEFQSKIKNVIQ